LHRTDVTGHLSKELISVVTVFKISLADGFGRIREKICGLGFRFPTKAL